jgi:hypothetical protein
MEAELSLAPRTRTRTRGPIGEYVPLAWDLGGPPPAHYVNGHVSPEAFRAEIERWFEDSKHKPSIPSGAKIEHVYVRSVRAPAESDHVMEWRHTVKGRGARPMTYWEIEPHRGVGA